MIELKRAMRRNGGTLHIVNRGTPFEPFVVCWNFDGSEWDWGTYCESLDEAEDVFQEKCERFGFELEL